MKAEQTDGYNIETLEILETCISREVRLGNRHAVLILERLRSDVVASIIEKLGEDDPVSVWLRAGNPTCLNSAHSS